VWVGLWGEFGYEGGFFVRVALGGLVLYIS